MGTSSTSWDGLSPLEGVAADVTAIWDALVESRVGPGLAACAPSSQKMRDEDYRVVTMRFREFVDKLECGAFAIFYFVGHALRVGPDDLRLLFADSSKATQDETSLSPFDVIRAFVNKGLAEWAIVLDCCHAGQVLRDRAVEGALSRTNRGNLIVCATGEGSAWETPHHGGLLTHYIVEAIRTGSCMPAEDEFVDLPSAARYARLRIKELHSELGSVPRIYLSGSADFWVARRTRASAPSGSTTPIQSVLFLGAEPDNASAAEKCWTVGACHTLGRHLAGLGVRLLTCNPWSGSADHHVCLGYSGHPGAKSITLFMPKGQQTVENLTELESYLDNPAVLIEKFWYDPTDRDEIGPESWQYCHHKALEVAEVVIALGGATGRSMSILLRLAEDRGIPVIPFSFLRGEAGATFERRRDLYTRLGVAADLKHRNGMERIADILLAAAVSRVNPNTAARRVFISRAKEDSALARALAEQLRIRGITPIFGDEPREAGSNPEATIDERLRRADVCALLWSAHFARSKHCEDERVLAHTLGRQIWLFTLDSHPLVLHDLRSLPCWHTPTTRAVEQWAAAFFTT